MVLGHALIEDGAGLRCDILAADRFALDHGPGWVSPAWPPGRGASSLPMNSNRLSPTARQRPQKAIDTDLIHSDRQFWKIESKDDDGSV
jgi:hypothetical protein